VPRVSLKEVAQKAGCSIATASNALRGTGEVASKTRERVQKVAKALGYRPNPVVASLAAHRFRRVDEYTSVPIALVHSEPIELGEGPLTIAQDLGFDPLPVRIAESNCWAELLREWYRQGVVGVVLSRITAPVDFQCEEWENFSVVATGGFLPDYPGSRVTRDFFWEIHHALDRIQALGYRRILCALGHHEFPLADDAMRESAAWHWAQHSLGDGAAFRIWNGPVRDMAPLRSEVEQWQPDVLVGLLGHYLHALDDAPGIAFAGLSLTENLARNGLSGFVDGTQDAFSAGFPGAASGPKSDFLRLACHRGNPNNLVEWQAYQSDSTPRCKRLARQSSESMIPLRKTPER